MISHYLNFLKVLILTSYTPLNAPTLNHGHEIERISFPI